MGALESFMVVELILAQENVYIWGVVALIELHIWSLEFLQSQAAPHMPIEVPFFYHMAFIHRANLHPRLP